MYPNVGNMNGSNELLHIDALPSLLNILEESSNIEYVTTRNESVRFNAVPSALSLTY